jgi:hypothetical protein
MLQALGSGDFCIGRMFLAEEKNKKTFMPCNKLTN